MKLDVPTGVDVTSLSSKLSRVKDRQHYLHTPILLPEDASPQSTASQRTPSWRNQPAACTCPLPPPQNHIGPCLHHPTNVWSSCISHSTNTERGRPPSSSPNLDAVHSTAGAHGGKTKHAARCSKISRGGPYCFRSYRGAGEGGDRGRTSLPPPVAVLRVSGTLPAHILHPTETQHDPRPVTTLRGQRW